MPAARTDACLSPIHKIVENKLVKLHKERPQGLADLQNPANFAKFYCTKSTKYDKIRLIEAALCNSTALGGDRIRNVVSSCAHGIKPGILFS